MQVKLLKYAVVGILSVSVDYFFLFILESWANIGVMYSVVAAFLISTLFNFYMNLKYTFTGVRYLNMQLAKYILTVVLSLAITMIIVDYSLGIGLHLYFSKSIAVLTLFLFNFYISNRYIFRLKK